MSKLNNIDLSDYFAGEPKKLYEFVEAINLLASGMKDLDSKGIADLKKSLSALDNIIESSKKNTLDWAKTIRSESAKIKYTTLENIELFGKVESAQFKVNDSLKKIAVLEKTLAETRKQLAQVNIEAMRAERLERERIRDEQRKMSAEAKQQQKEQTDAARKAAREQAAAEKEKQRAILATQKTVEGLKAKLSLLTEQRNKINIELDPEKFEKVQKQIADVNKQLKDIESAGGNDSRKVGGYKEGVKGALSEIATDLTGGLATAGIAGIAVAGVNVAIDGLNQFADALRGVQKELFEVQNSTGLTGENLNNFTASLQANTKVFGTDFNENLKAANALAQETGITFQESADILSKGIARGLDDDGLDNVKEYSTQLARVGFNAREIVELALAQKKNALFDDKLLDTYKEASTRLGDLTKGQRETLMSLGKTGQEIEKQFKSGDKVGAIQRLAEEVTKLEKAGGNAQPIISNLFGASGEDLGTKGIELIATLKGVNGELTQSQKNALAVQQADKDVYKKLNALSDRFKDSAFGLDMFIAKAKAFFLDEIIKIVDNIIILGQEFKLIYDEIANATEGIVDFAKKSEFLMKIVDLIKEGLSKFTFGGIGVLKNFLKESIAIFSGISAAFEGFSDRLSKAASQATRLDFSGASKTLSGFTEAFEKAYKEKLKKLTFVIPVTVKPEEEEKKDDKDDKKPPKPPISPGDVEKYKTLRELNADLAKMLSKVAAEYEKGNGARGAYIEAINKEIDRTKELIALAEKPIIVATTEIKNTLKAAEIATPDQVKRDINRLISDQDIKEQQEQLKYLKLQGKLTEKEYTDEVLKLEKMQLEAKLANEKQLKLTKLDRLQIQTRLLEIEKESGKYDPYAALAKSAAVLRDNLEDAFKVFFGDEKAKKIFSIVKLLAGVGAVISPQGSKAQGIFGEISGVMPRKFAEGVINLDVPGAARGKDSILSAIMPGESVMTVEETRNFEPLFQAIRAGQVRHFSDLYSAPGARIAAVPIPVVAVPDHLKAGATGDNIERLIVQHERQMTAHTEEITRQLRANKQDFGIVFDQITQQFTLIEQRHNQVNKYVYPRKDKPFSIRD